MSAFKTVLRKGWGSTGTLAPHSTVIGKPSPWIFSGKTQAIEREFSTIDWDIYFINVTLFVPHVSLQVTLHHPHFIYEENEGRQEARWPAYDQREEVGPYSHFPVSTEHILIMWAEPAAGGESLPLVSGYPIHRKFRSTTSCHVPTDEIMIPPLTFSVPPQPSSTQRRQTGFLYTVDTAESQSWRHHVKL